MAVIEVRIDSRGARVGSDSAVRDMRRIGDGAKRAGRDIVGLETRMTQFGATTSGVTRSLRRLVAGFGALIIARQGIRTVVAFDDAVIGVGKTTGLTGAALAGLSEEFINLSLRVPVSAARLADLGRVAGQMGVTGSKNILTFVETLARLESATDLVGENGAFALARLLNVTGEATSRVAVLGSVITALGNSMAATESEIANFATDLGAAIGIFDVTSTQVAALSATFAALGRESQASSTATFKAFANIEEAVKAGGAQLDRFAKTSGTTALALSTAFRKSALTGFVVFLEALKQLEEEGGSAREALKELGIADIRTAKALLPLISQVELLNDALVIEQAELENTVTLLRESEQAFGSISKQFAVVGNTLQAVILETDSFKDGLLALASTVRGAIILLANLEGRFDTGGEVMAQASASARALAGSIRLITAGLTALVAVKIIAFFSALATTIAGTATVTAAMALGLNRFAGILIATTTAVRIFISSIFNTELVMAGMAVGLTRVRASMIALRITVLAVRASFLATASAVGIVRASLLLLAKTPGGLFVLLAASIAAWAIDMLLFSDNTDLAADSMERLNKENEKFITARRPQDLPTGAGFFNPDPGAGRNDLFGPGAAVGAKPPPDPAFAVSQFGQEDFGLNRARVNTREREADNARQKSSIEDLEESLRELAKSYETERGLIAAGERVRVQYEAALGAENVARKANLVLSDKMRRLIVQEAAATFDAAEAANEAARMKVEALRKVERARENATRDAAKVEAEALREVERAQDDAAREAERAKDDAARDAQRTAESISTSLVTPFERATFAAQNFAEAARQSILGLVQFLARQLIFDKIAKSIEGFINPEEQGGGQAQQESGADNAGKALGAISGALGLGGALAAAFQTDPTDELAQEAARDTAEKNAQLAANQKLAQTSVQAAALLLSLLALEKGGAFAGGVRFFQKGGVFDQPTAFGSANGGLNVISENFQDEAVLPLKRTQSGDLGVQLAGGAGGGVIVNQFIATPNADSFGLASSQIANRMSEAVQRQLI